MWCAWASHFGRLEHPKHLIGTLVPLAVCRACSTTLVATNGVVSVHATPMATITLAMRSS
jgi:hypothetical protein